MASSTNPSSKLNLLLIGKTGSGKSETGNSLLMRKNAFESRSGTSSVTKEASFETAKFKDSYTLKVVDLPGIGDTHESTEENYKMVTTAAEKALLFSPEGYHVVLLVLRYQNRYTKEEKESVKALMNIFGDRIIIDHGIIVLTYGDIFEKDEICLEDFLEREKASNCEFNHLLALCNNRLVVFNNRLYPKENNTQEKKDKKLKMCEEQIQRLIDVITKNKLNLKAYTGELFEMAKRKRDKYLLELKEPILTENMQTQVSEIVKSLEIARHLSWEERKTKLEDALKVKETLEKMIEDEANGTDTLVKPKHIVSELGHQINTEQMLFQLEIQNKEIENNKKQFERTRTEAEQLKIEREIVSDVNRTKLELERNLMSKKLRQIEYEINYLKAQIMQNMERNQEKDPDEKKRNRLILQIKIQQERNKTLENIVNIQNEMHCEKLTNLEGNLYVVELEENKCQSEKKSNHEKCILS